MKVQLSRGRFLAMRVYVKKKKKHFNDSPHLKDIENKINLNPKTADSMKQQRLGQKWTKWKVNRYTESNTELVLWKKKNKNKIDST